MDALLSYFRVKIAMIFSVLNINRMQHGSSPLQTADVRLHGAPDSVRALAMRKDHFYGDGTPARPFVGGWLVEARAVCRNQQALYWLVENGFKRYGEYWGLPDDSIPQPTCAKLALG